MRHLVLLLTFILLVGAQFGCDSEQSVLPSSSSSSFSPELLLYCGTTMAPAMRKIADIFEQQEQCVVKIMRDGSGALLNSIHVNRVGDLYLPGSESYIDKCVAEGLVLESQPVGVNRVVLMVAAGNPLHISAELNNFVGRRYRTVLGLPQVGSIGNETRKLLEAKGIYAMAVEQATFLARDSKDIKQVIARGDADLGLDWYAAALTGSDKGVAVLDLGDNVAKPHILRLALLKYSFDPALAKKFITFVTSDVGQRILTAYGFKDADVKVGR